MIRVPKTHRSLALTLGLFVSLVGCDAGKHRLKVDREVYQILQQKQVAALNRKTPFTIERLPDRLRGRLLKSGLRDPVSLRLWTLS